eukprot:GFUD01042737.1.p1 GENE.GFUD01042737.1~~GFUD01042737.1.p1  ORF type:complete len:306 (+),score=72.36 GFUD01042737.1:24-920(+)
MEAAIQEQILSLEELSNDLITANLEHEDDPSKDVFEDLVLSKLQNIRKILESNDDDEILDMVDDIEICGDDEYSQKSIEQLLESVRSDVVSLDFKDDKKSISNAFLKKEKKPWYDRSFYICKQCAYESNAVNNIRMHLIQSHKVSPNLCKEANIKEYLSHFEEPIYSCRVCDNDIKHQELFIKRHINNMHSLSLESYEQKYENKVHNFKTISTKLEPSREQKPPVKYFKPEDPIVKQEFSSNNPRLTSVYLCPIPNCNFSTNKEGMRTSKAAVHLKVEHMIRAVDMKPGMYKFNKVKM